MLAVLVFTILIRYLFDFENGDLAVLVGSVSVLAVGAYGAWVGHRYTYDLKMKELWSPEKIIIWETLFTPYIALLSPIEILVKEILSCETKQNWVTPELRKKSISYNEERDGLVQDLVSVTESSQKKILDRRKKIKSIEEAIKAEVADETFLSLEYKKAVFNMFLLFDDDVCLSYLYFQRKIKEWQLKKVEEGPQGENLDGIKQMKPLAIFLLQMREMLSKKSNLTYLHMIEPFLSDDSIEHYEDKGEMDKYSKV